jgi:hypothetical protein
LISSFFSFQIKFPSLLNRNTNLCSRRILYRERDIFYKKFVTLSGLGIRTRNALDIRPFDIRYPAGYRILKKSGYPADRKMKI